MTTEVSTFSLLSAEAVPINPRARRGGFERLTENQTSMPESGENDARTLTALRERIDAIDAGVHRLLMERATVIEALIRTKGTSRPGAAFRPMREADMMRRLAARHGGVLPLAAIEHIWREIITTFTHLQAPFNVAVDTSVDGERMRDLARFVFGFSVKVVACADPEAVIADVAANGNLGLIARKARGPWWRALTRPKAPRIMALVPFIEAAETPIHLPAFVISPPLTDETPPDLLTHAATVWGPVKNIADVVVLATATVDGLTEALLAAPAGVPVAERAKEAGLQVKSIVPVGGFARGIVLGGSSTLLYAAAAKGKEPA
jgi:chorismate mutase/prephenate dehydratase